MTISNPHRGFTLVEVLVAMTIFAIAFTTLLASFNIVISNIDPLNKGLDDYEMARTSMDRIQKDLLSICLTHTPVYTRPDMDNTDEKDRFRLVSQTISFDENPFAWLRFASFEHLGFNEEAQGHIGIITYYIVPSEQGTPVLKRSDIASVFYDEKQETNIKNDPVLCERVKEFELMFIDQEGKIYENWNSDSSDFGYATPFAMKIKLSIGDAERSHTFATTLVLPTQREKNES
jgi:general secretion pathway protein J